MENALTENPFKLSPGMTVHEVRAVVAEIERVCMSLGEKMDLPIEHHFSKGVYAREMKLPAGALIVGKIHKHQNLNILSEGEVSVISADGSFYRVTAPFTLVASPGAKRVIYAHTPVTWTTIHGTDEKDLEKIEDEFIAKDYDEVERLYGKVEEQKCLG